MEEDSMVEPLMDGSPWWSLQTFGSTQHKTRIFRSLRRNTRTRTRRKDL